MDRPLFSVILPVRDAALTLPATLASLLAQTLGDWEALVIDDASTDGGLARVRELAGSDRRLRLLGEGGAGPRGAAETRNIGIRAARGRHVAFLDSDDLWLPAKLERQAEAFADGATIVFSSYRRIDAEGRPLSVVRAAPRVAWDDALGGNPIGCLTAAYDTEAFGRAEMPLLPTRHDYALWLRLLRTGAVAHGLPEVLAEYRVRPGSLSSNKLKGALAVWRLLGDEGVGPARRTAGFARYAARSVVRRLT
ncbi:glycosyltransferase family 2 protein [Rubellimicrobium aerolatum]|uniref:Glycosyltransferase family 2 protein n=1 Tax=Rubellimicrobium aerolatum TaxID=490979 RepID=A0ABW0SBU5_9RHOB|nr:glycosyltransferase family 2 protein [Rubellimicrobium aerolatum]MBP1805948.1 glycosyltransferase involved in cell wall biosynthesis [Rubellimicrobium aerolatum]